MTAMDRPKLDHPTIAELSRKEVLRPAVYCALVALGILAGWAVGILTPNPWALLPAAIWIGALQHHLSIIHHEANHFLLFPNRKWNERIGAIAAGLTGFTMEYRRQHLAHHQRLGQMDDPDLPNYLHYPNGWGHLLGDLLFHLSGLAASRQFVRQQTDTVLSVAPAPPRERRRALVLVAGLQLMILVFFTLSGKWWLYFVLWLFPVVTVTKTLTHFRNVAEHVLSREPRSDPELARYRTILCGPIERFFFAPMNFNYHAEHHSYPSVPYFRLPELHKRLRSRPEYDRCVDVDSSYIQVILKKALR